MREGGAWGGQLEPQLQQQGGLGGCEACRHNTATTKLT